MGELALKTNEPRAATIKCATECKFLVINKELRALESSKLEAKGMDLCGF